MPLRFRLTAEPATLDWTLARSSHETYLIMNLMEGLVSAGPGSEPIPALAERWEISADGRAYVFHLRPSVKWSDGRELRAQDFVDSWLRLLDRKTRSSYASYLFGIENAESFHAGKKPASSVGVRALGANRLEVRLREPMPHFLHLLTFWVTFPQRSDLVRKHGKDWARPGRLATLGPYSLEAWEKGSRIRLKRNPSYYGKTPSVEAAEGRVVVDDREARALFAGSKLDFLQDATTQDLVGTKARVERFAYHATYYLGFRSSSGKLSDPAIRKALASAVDRERIPAVLQGGQVVANGFISPGIAGAADQPVFTGTLFGARGVFAKRGYAEGQGFPKLTLWIEKFDGAEKLGPFLKQGFKEALGIDVDAKVAVSAQEYQDSLKAGRADLFVGHWGADFPEASGFLDVFSSKSGTNPGGWSDPSYDRLLDEARAQLDPSKRVSLYARAEKLLVDESVALLPLFHRRNTVLMGPRIERFSISPLNYLFFRDVSLKR